MLILTSFQPTDTYSSAILDPLTGYLYFKRVIMGTAKISFIYTSGMHNESSALHMFAVVPPVDKEYLKHIALIDHMHLYMRPIPATV